MNAHVSVLDKDKLRKIIALMMGGATEGERAAARSRAEAIAARAGMELSTAFSILNSTPYPGHKAGADVYEGWMEAAYPGYRARKAAEEAVKEAAHQAKLQAFIDEFGSEEAIFAETERERLLRAALAPLADRKKFSNSEETYIAGYAGWICRNPPPPLWDALRDAYPFPDDIAGVWQEFQEWEHLSDVRCAFEPYADTAVWVRARTAALEHLLDTMSAASFDAFAIRLEWLSHVNNWEFNRDREVDAAVINAMREDLEALKRAHHGSVQSGRGTAAERRKAVLSMLDMHLEWSDREIARHIGVSPQTVNTWRKRTANRPHDLFSYNDGECTSPGVDGAASS